MAVSNAEGGIFEVGIEGREGALVVCRPILKQAEQWSYIEQ